MTQAENPNRDLTVKSSAVTDRGLNPKRPLNEDSFLADSARGIFVVADGVGGAEAGEVASQTAIEVLDQAFRAHVDGADIEDLMELAIQRANASIFRMAQENPKFSMMATTVVGLHVEGNRATIGHVGDSRLYRLTPAGQLLRETADHSVVEEEVRAGRMTAEQAANHPSKNVISRALGAEDGVEVDMKVIEVDDGTEFLLCSDGITRHIPDHELRQLLLAYDDLAAACAELKKRCFERGAEDNLTAVLVCVGTPISAQQRAEDAEKTISPETEAVAAAAASPVATTVPEAPQILTPASRKAFPALAAQDVRPERTLETPLNIGGPPQTKSAGERAMTRIFLFIFLIAAVAGAFYAGRKYRGPIPYVDEGQAVAELTPTPAAVEDPLIKFERGRRTVDANPVAWLNQLGRNGVLNPLESADPEFLYLYGRASLLAGNTEEARQAFEAAIAKAGLAPSPENATISKEAAFGLAGVALKSDKDRPAAMTRFDEVTRSQPSPGSSVSPSSSPLGSP
jgi:protein phosphatase